MAKCADSKRKAPPFSPPSLGASHAPEVQLLGVVGQVLVVCQLLSYVGATQAITVLEVLLLARDELIELATLLALDLLLLDITTLDELLELELEILDELFNELTTDELETLVAAVLDLLELDTATEDELLATPEQTLPVTAGVSAAPLVLT